MSEKRRDSKGRILHNGEVQQKDGRYRFKYYDSTGKDRYLYSWRLDRNDKTPAGKRTGPSLRELEKKLQADMFDHIVTNGGNLTVLELVEKYVATRTGVIGISLTPLSVLGASIMYVISLVRIS